MAIENVAVVGGGFMGSGIAETVARAGIPVVLTEVDDAALERARAAVTKSLDRAVARGRLDAGERDALLARIEFTTALEAIARADLVVEAVPENLELKRGVFAKVGSIVGADALVASNTSSIPIAELAAQLPGAERSLGMHFFSPVPQMRLVELVRALDTSEATIAAARDFAERIGKHPIETRDRSGFIVNMLLIPYLMAAIRMYEDGFATREDIDAGMELGCNHPMGPLTLADFIGLDVLYSVGVSLYEEFAQPEYMPPPLLKRMLSAGRRGRKSGRGFYDYREGKAQVTPPKLAAARG